MLKKSPIASVVVRNQVGAEVTFNVPMHDFAAAFDGPPVDPKKIEEQNKALQEQLEKKAQAAARADREAAALSGCSRARARRRRPNRRSERHAGTAGVSARAPRHESARWSQGRAQLALLTLRR